LDFLSDKDIFEEIVCTIVREIDNIIPVPEDRAGFIAFTAAGAVGKYEL
jgi:hypothetical protein